MHMLYSLDAENSKFEEYRLTKGRNWRRLMNGNFDLAVDDCIFFSPEQLPEFSEETVLTLGGETYFVNANPISFGGPHASVYPRLHRSAKPRKFTLGELVNVIANGDDSKFNILVLDIEGHLKLVDFDQHSNDDPLIAVRYETFCAENKYVGMDAAEDDAFTTELYLNMLDSWVTHLRTRKLNIMDDVPTQENEKDLLAQIDEIFTC